MDNLLKEYFDCCDRLYLNYLALNKMPTSKQINDLIDKDEKIKEKLEKELNV